jgi:hypothetical protein
MLYHFNYYLCLGKVFLKYCSLFLLMLALDTAVYCQVMDPEIDQMTQDVIKWTQDQFQKYGKVDPHKLDSLNQLIRDRQAEIDLQKKAMAVSNDTIDGKLINKALVQGNMLVVPAGKIWNVRRVTCQTGAGEYSVLVTSVKFKDRYLASEKIIMPAFTPEASLLTSDMSTISYNFVILESEIK